ncbi:hypothetical protein ScPMuIL_011780 [Solemya velum]
MTQGKILGRIGPYSISDSSIRHLRGAISDEIIDAYFYLLDEKSPSICHINCIVMTAIFNGSTERLGILQRENFNAYDCIFGAVNEGGSHWTLVLPSPIDLEDKDLNNSNKITDYSGDYLIISEIK